MFRLRKSVTAIEGRTPTTESVLITTKGNFAIQPPCNASTEQIVLLALATEDYHARCYQEWVARFRPFDPSAVTLLESFAEEESQHKQQLLQLNLQLPKKGKASHMIHQTVGNLKTHRHPNSQHFLVINDRMAAAIMQATIKQEHDAPRFYTLCLSTSKDPRLRALCQQLGQLEQQQTEVLIEFKERFYTA